MNDLGPRYVMEEVGSEGHLTGTERSRCVTDGGRRQSWPPPWACWPPAAAPAAPPVQQRVGGLGRRVEFRQHGRNRTGASSASGIKTASTSKGTVLVNSQGRTLYWFAIDTPTSSKCSGTCATFWPPVLGKPSMASGASLSGTFGTIKRSGGTASGHLRRPPAVHVQAGHHAGPGQRQRHQHLGGLWWAMTPSGAKLAAAQAELLVQQRAARRLRLLTVPALGQPVRRAWPDR